MCFFGDGAANEGAVHEAMNMASIWSLPVIFVCENNLYGASTPFGSVSKLENVADRASAYGMRGMIADGSDVIAVHDAALDAVQYVRKGNGPVLLECKTYRLCGHSRSDPLTYRTKEEEALWRDKEPIKRLGEWFVAHDKLAQVDLAGIEHEVELAIDDAVAYADASPYPLPEDALKHVFFQS